MELKDSRTKENLLRAFAGESQARNRYEFAAEVAKREGWQIIHDLFKYTADQEKAHARVYYDALKQFNGENININEEVMNKVLELENVYKVSDGNLITDFLKTMSKYVRIFGIALILILVISSTILISNVIKVSVFVRKREIGIMKYIGATDNYIRLPFIIEGAVIGALGAGISALMVSIVHSLVNTNMSEILVSFIPGFYITPLGNIMIILLPLLFFMGITIGVVGSLISLKKYLIV